MWCSLFEGVAGSLWSRRAVSQKRGGAAPYVSRIGFEPDPADPWRRLDERETRRRVWSLLKVLPRRHREVLVRRYGLAGGREQTHTQVAAALGIGDERSRQLEHEALHRLRELEARHEHAA
jgi:DNA-directed RNA polymerase sigma subunit (sigma70/sigma32)